MNQRGQSFSVFKLLIAAIVAVFILTIMLQILQNINPPAQGNPNQEASSKIKTLVSATGTPERTKTVIFKKDTPILSARTIAKATGVITDDFICVTVSDTFSGGQLFDTTNEGFNGIIQFIGGQDLQTKLLILCDAGNIIDTTAGQTGVGSDFPGCSQPGNDNTVCYVSIVSTN